MALMHAKLGETATIIPLPRRDSGVEYHGSSQTGDMKIAVIPDVTRSVADEYPDNITSLAELIQETELGWLRSERERALMQRCRSYEREQEELTLARQDQNEVLFEVDNTRRRQWQEY